MASISQHVTRQESRHLRRCLQALASNLPSSSDACVYDAFNGEVEDVSNVRLACSGGAPATLQCSSLDALTRGPSSFTCSFAHGGWFPPALQVNGARFSVPKLAVQLIAPDAVGTRPAHREFLSTPLRAQPTPTRAAHRAPLPR